MSYKHDYDPFERNFMTRIISYKYDFETDKNLSHKQTVLFDGHPVTLTRGTITQG